MADYTKSGGINTAKARRKDSAARNKALGLATRGRDKQGQTRKQSSCESHGHTSFPCLKQRK